MNAFFTDNLCVSKINLCVLVPGGTSQPIHRNRPSHGLVINLSGEKIYLFKNGDTHRTKAEELFYLPKFSDYNVQSDEIGDCIAVNFDLANADVTYPFFSLTAGSGHKYVPEFRKLLEEWNTRRDGYMNRCFLLLYNIICMIQQDRSPEYIPSRNRKLVDDATEYISAHLADPSLTVGKIALVLGVTPEYFRRLFHQFHGVSPKEYIMIHRMEKARELIGSGELRIGAVARMCGYDNESYFSREFRRLNNCTPIEYARMILK